MTGGNGNDYADTQGFILGGGQFSNAGFKFTSANQAVTATTASLQVGDTLVDATTSDSDALNLALSGNNAAVGAATVRNIETVTVTATNTGNAGTIDFTNYSGLKTITVSGAPTTGVTLTTAAGTANTLADTGVTTIDASGITSAAGALSVNTSASVSSAALTVKGGAGADFIVTGTGADIITGGAGADTIATGAGADTIDTGAGANAVDAGSGDDKITGGSGADVIVAGTGDDNVTAGNGADTIVLGTVAAGAGATALVNGANGDTITYANGQITGVDGSAGNNSNAAFAARAILGTDFAVQAGETVTGGGATSTARLIATSAGTDTVVLADTVANNGNDTIYAFNAGALANGGDVLNVNAFLGAAVSYTEVGTGDGANDARGSNVIVVTNNTWANAVGEGVTLTAGQKYVIVEYTDANGSNSVNAGDSANVYFVTADGAGVVNTANSQVATLVGVVTDGTGLLPFVAANFA